MKRSGWGLIFLIAFLSAGGLWFFLKSNPRRDALRVRETATRKLGEYLARAYPGHHVLVISNPFAHEKAVAREIASTEEAGIAGLKLGLGNALTLEGVVFPELKPEAQINPRSVYIDPQTTTPLSFLVAPNAFDKLTTEHPNCDLIVSLIGLPADLEQVRCWRAEGPPRFALLLPDLRFVGNAAAVQRAVKSGKLPVFVLNKPPAESGLGANGKKSARDEQLLLVTSDNIDQVLSSYPQLFPSN